MTITVPYADYQADFGPAGVALAIGIGLVVFGIIGILIAMHTPLGAYLATSVVTLGSILIGFGVMAAAVVVATSALSASVDQQNQEAVQASTRAIEQAFPGATHSEAMTNPEDPNDPLSFIVNGPRGPQLVSVVPGATRADGRDYRISYK